MFGMPKLSHAVSFLCGYCFKTGCHRNLETSQHLFCECPIVLKVWEGTTILAKQASLHPCNWSGMSSLLDWFKGTLAGAAPAAAPGTLALAILITWTVWKERNRCVLQRKELTVPLIISTIQDEACLWVQAGNKHLDMLLSGLE